MAVKPPLEIDGAEVILWAWSPTPFFVMLSTDGAHGVAIHGLAICRYKNPGSIYRFSCNAGWETENDSPYSTVEEAMKGESGQYDIHSVEWNAPRDRPAGLGGLK